MNEADVVKKKTIAILGTGAVGGFLASVFWKAGEEVQCIDKPENVERIKRDGIVLRSEKYGTFTAHPAASDGLTARPDILFVTVKAPGLTDALKSIDPELVSGAVVIPLLNGLEHVEKIRGEFGKCVAAGSISIGVLQRVPGTVDHVTSFVGIELASDADISQDRLTEVADWLTSIGIKGHVDASEAEVLWKKLIRLNALACCTTATDRPIGELRTDPVWRERIRGCVAEASSVAKTQGIDIAPDLVMEQIDALDPMQMSSMQRDVSAGKVSEADAIPGAILRLAMRAGIPCPHIAGVFAMVERKAEARINEIKLR
jgi:2-dehydropantoate 2-reductase